MIGLLCVHTSPATVSHIASHHVLGDIIQPASSSAADMITRTGVCFIHPHINTLWLVYYTSVLRASGHFLSLLQWHVKECRQQQQHCFLYFNFIISFMGMHDVLEAKNLFEYFSSWEQKRRQMISPMAGNTRREGSTTGLTMRRPLRFIVLRVEAEKTQTHMTNLKINHQAKNWKQQHCKRIFHSKCYLYTTGPSVDRGSGDVDWLNIITVQFWRQKEFHPVENFTGQRFRYKTKKKNKILKLVEHVCTAFCDDIQEICRGIFLGRTPRFSPS